MKLGMPEVLKVPYKCCISARWPRIPTGIYVYYVFQCINLFQNGQSLLLSWHNYKLVYLQELSRTARFCTNSNKYFFGGGPPDPPFKQNCLSLYYNHNTANHVKKLKTHTQISPLHHFSGKLKIKWSLNVLFEKSIVDNFFRKWMFKRTKKSPWKLLENVRC